MARVCLIVGEGERERERGGAERQEAEPANPEQPTLLTGKSMGEPRRPKVEETPKNGTRPYPTTTQMALNH